MKSKGPVVHLKRQQKAMMIEAFLRDGLGRDVRGFHVLDLGCGNGQISQHFSASNTVSSVDVKDQRDDKSKGGFFLVVDEKLPFEDDSFDIVISHHVIEHVEDQSAHLSEFRRVLKPDGIGYLACPNGASPFMAGHVGNDQVPSRKRIYLLMNEQNFEIEECYTRLLREPDRYHCETRLGRYVPAFLLKMLRAWYPGHCFLVRKPLVK